MPEKSESMVRRKFLKQAGLGTAAIAAAGSLLPQAPLGQEVQAAGMSNRQAIVFLLGDTLIPSEPDDPGYRDMEWYGITEEVMKGLGDISDEDFETFNRESKSLFEENSFLDLDEDQRAEYLNLIIDGGRFAEQLLGKLQSVYRKAGPESSRFFIETFRSSPCRETSMTFPLCGLEIIIRSPIPTRRTWSLPGIQPDSKALSSGRRKRSEEH